LVPLINGITKTPEADDTLVWERESRFLMPSVHLSLRMLDEMLVRYCEPPTNSVENVR